MEKTAKKIDVSASVTPNSPPVSGSVTDRRTLGKEKLEKYMKEELKMVKGQFRFFECEGMSTKVTVIKYKGHVFEKEMRDGETYEIPLYVARFLNGVDVTAEALDGKLGTCGYRISEHLMDKNGSPMVVQNKSKRRFGFNSLDFGAAV